MQQPQLGEPIAVVGSSCRFAGGATSPSRLWDVLSNPSDLSREVPRERWNARAFYHPNGEYHGTTDSIKAYWLDQDHRVFDASFFNVTPREAEAMDPQQRMALEVVYEAMESAGYTLQQYSGKQVAVFAGVMTGDYETHLNRDELQVNQYIPTGNARSIISNRLSYFFDFRGPSMTVDTACSSSLVALHQAVLSLRAGETIMACVAGVNLMLTPEQFISESSLHMLSPTGKSRMWDVSADGYARGEGVAAILLKPLSAALADGDEIMAIIRETGVNSDGRTKGITLPNSEAQTRLIKETYQKAALDPSNPSDRCQYFEAHGTGTQAGDPREAAAIHNAFFNDQNNDDELLVGSVKTVVGHTEGAAGLAGLLKVIQAMKHGAIPPNLHFDTINPSIEQYSDRLKIPTSLKPWPPVACGQPRRASVNSFGFGGTNAHAIVERYEPSIHDSLCRQIRNPQDIAEVAFQKHLDADVAEATCGLPITLSAISPKSLKDTVEAYLKLLERHQSTSCDQLAWNLWSRRTAHVYRIAFSASTKSGLMSEMEAALSKYQNSSDIGVRVKASNGRPKILGVFTGQGAQWVQMSKLLFESNKLYRHRIQSLDNILKNCQHPPIWTLEEQILAGADTSRVHEAAVSQPLCTALQIGLVDLLAELGVQFHTVVGHSSGEIGAAYAAGMIEAKDAILISYYRGMFAHLGRGRNGERGSMLAAGITGIEAKEVCQIPELAGKIFIAAINAPSSVTISGDQDAVEVAQKLVSDKGKFTRALHVDTAYHSPHMNQPAAAYAEALSSCNISPRTGGNGVSWVSSVDGYHEEGIRDLKIEYWIDNMVNTVQFSSAIEKAVERSGPFDGAIEIGPHPALKGPVLQTLKGLSASAIPYTGVLDRTANADIAVSKFIGFMWTHLGPSSIELRNYIARSESPSLLDFRINNLPSYPWDHSRQFYSQGRLGSQYHHRVESPHELLGVRTRDDNELELRWRNVLKLERLPWTEGHKFQGKAMIPASAYCVMALDAARVLLKGREASTIHILNLDIARGIILESDSPGVEILFSLTVLNSSKNTTNSASMSASFTLASCAASGSSSMVKNMSGELKIEFSPPSVDALPMRQSQLSETLPTDPDAFYKMMDKTGLKYTGPFRSLKSIDRRYRYALTTLSKRHHQDTTTLRVSPATLDSCFQSCFLAFAFPGDKSLWTSFLPVKIDSIVFNLATCDFQDETVASPDIYVENHLIDVQPPQGNKKAEITVDLDIFNEAGQKEIAVEGLTVSPIASNRPQDDYELYLHTVMGVDPEDEIVRPDQVIHSQQQFNSHVTRIIKQIGHRFRRLNVLDLSEPELELTENLLRNHHLPFASYTVGSQRDDAQLEKIRSSNVFQHIITEANSEIVSGREKQQTSPGYDLVIASLVELEGDGLDSIRSSMCPGGYLVVLQHGFNSILVKQQNSMAPTNKLESSILPSISKSLEKPDHWRSMRNSEQLFSSELSVIVKQAVNEEIQRLTNPLSTTHEIATKNLLIIGGNNSMTSGISSDLKARISPFCDVVSSVDGLDSASDQALADATAAILLTDLDQSVMENMTEQLLHKLRRLCRPNMIVLWLTSGARADNPSHAATLGFTRTIAAEVPNLSMTVIDLDKIEGSSIPITEAFLRAANHFVLENEGKSADMLWVREREVYFENGRRLISRVLPWDESNARLNSRRRVVLESHDALQKRVEIVTSLTGDGSRSFDVEFGPAMSRDEHDEKIVIQVQHSSLHALKLTDSCSAYICVGADVATGELVVALASSNASYITASSKTVINLGSTSTITTPQIDLMLRYLITYSILLEARNRPLGIVGADDALLACFDLVSHSSAAQLFKTGANGITKANFHPHVSRREIKSAFPRQNTLVIDFTPEKNDLSERIRQSLPSSYGSYKSISSFFGGNGEIHPKDENTFGALLKNALEFSLDKAVNGPAATMKPAILSVSAVLQNDMPFNPFHIIDWTTDLQIQKRVNGSKANLLRPDKTYILIGLTRDLGQSLCTLFIEQGARHIVLASRNPNQSPRWREYLSSRYDANIAIERLDVTVLDSVSAFKTRISTSMPPVAGVVNGAMVLDDRVFAQMSVETWNRVLHPKTIGSKNLDVCFDDPSLDFFLMTSSFAAIGGHLGQSNYAAANMYMNGLAANRHKRGLCASVLNIGVIYGLGFLEREKKELYAGLEREGYPPISEHDLHHMFLEAIVAGRPGTRELIDITTGLSRYTIGSAQPQHWHEDPRFCHFTRNEDGSDEDGEAAQSSLLKGTEALRPRIAQQIKASASSELIADTIFPFLARKLETLFGLPEASISSKEHGVTELGVDSLVAVEIRNWVWKAVGQDLAVLQILSATSVYNLCLDISKQMVA